MTARVEPVKSEGTEEEGKAAVQAQQCRAGWRLPERYRYRRLLGAGSYGQVCEARDLSSGGEALVAIKRIPKVFDSIGDGKRILRELAILRKLEPSPYVVALLDVLVTEDVENFQELYLVLEHAGQDLRAVARCQPVFTERAAQKLLRDFFLGLSHLHASGVFHRDLKPANCLVRRGRKGSNEGADDALQWELKICDLGHARAVGRESSTRDARPGGVRASAGTTMARSLTCHVATRWYRAPELILLQGNYTSAVDVWSAGCVAAELFRMLPDHDAPCESQRGPLLPGDGCFPLSPHLSPRVSEEVDNDLVVCGSRDQLALILNLVGSPSEEEVDEITGDAPSLVAKTARRYLKSFPHQKPADLAELFPASSSTARELLGSLLQFSPKRRAKVEDVLAHEFFAGLPRPEEDGRCSRERAVVDPLDFEAAELDVAQLRRLIWREVSGFCPEATSGVEE